jgi:hypothetical protein
MCKYKILVEYMHLGSHIHVTIGPHASTYLGRYVAEVETTRQVWIWFKSRTQVHLDLLLLFSQTMKFVVGNI